jgi:hypothetical protein
VGRNSGKAEEPGPAGGQAAVPEALEPQKPRQLTRQIQEYSRGCTHLATLLKEAEGRLEQGDLPLQSLCVRERQSRLEDGKDGEARGTVVIGLQ